MTGASAGDSAPAPGAPAPPLGTLTPPPASDPPSAPGVPAVPRLRRLVPTHPSLSESQARRARRAAAFLLVLAASGLLGLFLSVAANPASLRTPTTTVSLLVLLVIGASYFLTRTRHPDLGALTACGAMIAVLWVLHALQADPSAANEVLYYFAAPILTASLLLPVRWTFVVLLLVFVASAPVDMFFNHLLPHEHEEASDSGVLAFLVMVAGAGVVFGAVNGRDLRLLEERTVELDQANARLKEADAERVRLLHQVAHDLASPLSPVRLQLRLLHRDIGDGVAPRVQVIERNLHHVQRLVEDVKDLARVDGRTMKLQVQDLDLASLVREAAATFQPGADERRVRLEVNAPAALLVAGDAVRITQVLHNLVSNALKFTPEGGTVRVAAAAHPGGAEVAVSDTGAGLEPAQVARLFRPFSQVHETPLKRPEDKGTGLGLYITKGIVEAHGGTLDVASEGRGRGATFTFRLPSKEAQQE